jgi:hypothetical protein
MARITLSTASVPDAAGTSWKLDAWDAEPGAAGPAPRQGAESGEREQREIAP